MPIHCTYRAGSVKKPKISGGVPGMCMLTSTGAISVMAGSYRAEPVVEAVIMAGRLADLNGAVGVHHRATGSQRHRRVQAADPDQRVPA